ncbi:hypothetical protein N7414_23070 [Pseudomonas sp. GD04087]|nr:MULTISPECIES: hypothetical protein [unclassified Pseudomonas]MDH0292016.1 hypothetical protein [Pseudomonas sp. GD04087]MDH1052864.1 hypothetical protein [Pseudomonas sp. GD03903]
MSKSKTQKGLVVARDTYVDVEVKRAKARGQAFLSAHADTYRSWMKDTMGDFRGPLAGSRKQAFIANAN